MEEQDVVFYRLFPQLDAVENSFGTSGEDVEERLEELKTRGLGIALSIAEGYIWQHEPFNLRVFASYDKFLSSSENSKQSTFSELPSGRPSGTDFVPCLAGKVKFGDNLADEWLAVYILFEISRQLPSLSITVRDSDGEFLLIEAAYVIPKWLNPDNSHNRVFIRQGAIHLVPFPPGTPRARKSSGASLKNSLRLLEDSGSVTKAPIQVQNAILDRIADYTGNVQKTVHKVRCRLPLPVAHILFHEPQLISLAVESFYSRDADSMKAASRMEKFLEKDNDGNVQMVDAVVRMSRAMYAQLKQQVFQAPRTYPMPRLNSPNFTGAEIGMKVTVGFEMTYWERSVSEETDSYSAEKTAGVADASMEPSQLKQRDIAANDPAWKKYMTSLYNRGYFRGLLEGSREHQELLQAAITDYRNSSLFARVSAAMNAPAKRIDELLAIPHGVKDFANANLEGDDDSWMYDGESDLTAALLGRQKEMDDYDSRKDKGKLTGKSATNADNLPSEDVEMAQAAEVVRSMQSFVDKMSSFEGAEIPTDPQGSEDQPVDVDMSRLMKELSSVFEAKEIAEMLSGNIADESSDPSDSDLDDSSSETSEDEMRQSDPVVQPEGRSLQGTGSRIPLEKAKGKDTEFNDEYSSVMDLELKSTSLAKSFTKGKEIATTSENVKVEGADGKETAAKSESRAVPRAEVDEDDSDENDLVDVDVNLVESLLRSYGFQQGMPGPASNLLGAMGIELPDNADQRPATRWKETVVYESRVDAADETSSDDDA